MTHQTNEDNGDSEACEDHGDDEVVTQVIAMCGVVDPHKEGPDESIPARLDGLELTPAEFAVVAACLVQPLLQTREVDITQAPLFFMRITKLLAIYFIDLIIHLHNDIFTTKIGFENNNFGK